MRFANANKLHRKSGGGPTLAFLRNRQQKQSKNTFSAHVRFGERGAPVQYLSVLLGG